ncbi:AraC family transcriptional regulator [Geodermatophilus sabuli]|uniref:Transcriptional regulator, AraC family n=1 Tax=Geodermatophilus sabuli TaxID=1564158 RepID=A0A285EAU9_9ACTN|nr:AraC family transcriptional regulator [Geodermatophilus sabuli]MBB3085407.1 AraC-like DNA-binding protein [Geodermatophilus sabuli]SNX96165.1 transcriptional regulator, AraC family [Geodermatophilus sabuli]
MDRFVRYAVLIGYPQLAHSLGLDPERLLAAEGLDAAELIHQDRWTPAPPVARLLERSAAESGQEDFAVRLAAMRRFSALGPLSVVLREEPDLRSALELLIRYQHAYSGILDMRLIEADGLATVQAWLEFGEPVPIRQAVDHTMTALLLIIRTLVRADWEPLAVYFSHPAPADLTVFHQVFGTALRFDHEFTGVSFPARDLDTPTVTADPALRTYTRQLLQSLPAPRVATTADEVATLVEFLLPLGRCSMPHVSRDLGVQPRTLHRRLAAEGQTFSGIVQSTRARLAPRHLADARLTLTQISCLLGFATPSAFSTWFRQSFGTSASDWRARTCTGPAAQEQQGVEVGQGG